MQHLLGGHFLSLVVFLPLLGAIVVLALPERLAHVVATAWAVVVFVLSALLWPLYRAAATAGVTFPLAEGPVAWLPSFGVGYQLGLDGVSLLLVLLTTFLSPVVLLSSFASVTKGIRLYTAMFLVLETALLGTFSALDVFLFYVFWEAVLVPMYFIIGMWGGPRRVYATLKFVLFTMAGSLLMLVALIVLYRLHAVQRGFPSTALSDLLLVRMPDATQNWVFLALALAFAIKVPMVPLHTWLPDAHVEAPTGGSVILAGVLLKMGTYGFYRFALPLAPSAAHRYSAFFIGLAVIGVIWGALAALAQQDVKKLVAYSSVSHLGLCMLGLFALTPAAVTGGVLQMLNHGLSTGALFLLVGIVYERRHTRRIADFGGLAKVMPAFSTLFVVVALSSIGLPGLNGFVGEFLILAGAFPVWPVATIFATTTAVLGAFYVLWMVQRVFFGPVRLPENERLSDLSAREVAVIAPIVLLIVVLGVWPQPFVTLVGPSVENLIHTVAAGGVAH
jgi:NADH-quinone oxidoreductase subunit M